MFKVDDTILYGTEGVCKVKEITSKKFGDYVNDYYVLEPVYARNSILYVPIKNKKLKRCSGEKNHQILQTISCKYIISKN